MVQQFAAAQEQQGTNVTLPSYNSPQSLIIQQPSSVGPSMQQSTPQQKGPNSVPSAIYQHHPHGKSFILLVILQEREEGGI